MDYSVISTMDRKRNTKARGRKTLRQKSFRTRQGPNGYGYVPPTVSLTRWISAPPSIEIKLRYNIDRRLNAAAAYDSFGWYANGMYDVDPSVGSTAMPGFVEWMALYNTYQVISTRVNVAATNLSATTPYELEFLFLQGTVAAGSLLPTYYGNTQSETKMISIAGGQDRAYFQKTINMAEIVGADTYWGEVGNYTGTAGTNPATPIQFVFGIASPTGATSSGCCISGYIEFVARLSAPKLLSA